jgi:hypothetical protein
MPCICLLPLTHSRALYLFRDPSGRRFHLYVQISSRYLVLAGNLVFGMNSKVFMSINPSISVLCALINLFASTCLFICACVNTSGFFICMAYNVGSRLLRNMSLIPGPRSNRQSWWYLDEVRRSASRAPDNKSEQRDKREYLE